MSNFDSFKASFKGDVVTPSDEGYEQAIKRWAANAEKRAKVVAFVKNADDVVQALKYARADGLPIAVRGGGHSPAGASSIENGLVIDLSKYLNTCRVDTEKKLGYVGGGAVWGTVDGECIKHGLATVGGTVNHVGISLYLIRQITDVHLLIFRLVLAGKSEQLHIVEKHDNLTWIAALRSVVDTDGCRGDTV
jgi:hypothetical protein